MEQDSTIEELIIKVKTFRVELDEVLQKVKGSHKSREMSLTVTKIQEAIMWLETDLKRLNIQKLESHDPLNLVAKPTADNPKM